MLLRARAQPQSPFAEACSSSGLASLIGPMAHVLPTLPWACAAASLPGDTRCSLHHVFHGNKKNLEFCARSGCAVPKPTSFLAGKSPVPAERAWLWISGWREVPTPHVQDIPPSAIHWEDRGCSGHGRKLPEALAAYFPLGHRGSSPRPPSPSTSLISPFTAALSLGLEPRVPRSPPAHLIAHAVVPLALLHQLAHANRPTSDKEGTGGCGPVGLGPGLAFLLALCPPICQLVVAWELKDPL